MTKQARVDNVAQLFELSRQSSRLLFRQASAMLPPDSPGLSVILLLKMVKERGHVSQHEIAECLCVSNAAVSRHITNLIEKQYIESSVNPQNRRQTIITLSKQGNEALKKADQAIEAQFIKLLEPASDEQLHQILEANKLLHNLLLQTSR